jgi:hypothetical protein
LISANAAAGIELFRPKFVQMMMHANEEKIVGRKL